MEDASLSAFTARTGIKFNNQKLLLDALTHTSFPNSPDQSSRFQLLGERVLNLYATDFIMKKYPLVPVQVVETLVDAYVGPKSLASIGKGFGLQHLVRWKMTPNSQTTKPSAGSVEKVESLPLGVTQWILQAMVGALYQEQGPKAVKELMLKHVLSRSVDAEEHINVYLKLNKPRKMLTELIKSQSKPKPVARLIKETGRHSQAPIFIVGMYSGFEKLSEGVGSSKQMAETRAVKNALISYYHQELKNVDFIEGEDDESITFFEEQ